MFRKEIRVQIRNRRRELSPQFQLQASKNIVSLIEKDFPSVFSRGTFAIYLTNDGELDTSALIKHLWKLGKKVCLPVISEDGSRRMTFREYLPDSRIEENRYGIQEPAAENCEIPLEQIDVVFTPLVAFDANGNRLGMGGGFYDCTLREKAPRTMVIGLAHDLQQVDTLPAEAWDVPLPCIATPSRIFHFKQQI